MIPYKISMYCRQLQSNHAALSKWKINHLSIKHITKVADAEPIVIEQIIYSTHVPPLVGEFSYFLQVWSKGAPILNNHGRRRLRLIPVSVC